VGAPALGTSAATDTGPAEFVRSLGNQAIEVIRSGTSAEEKNIYFRRVLREDFALIRSLVSCSARIGGKRVKRNGRNSKTFFKTTWCASMVSALRNLRVRA
jgi:hypothetical protein